MTIRLHLKRMKVARVVEDEIDKLVIEVADTRRVVRCRLVDTRPPPCTRPAVSSYATSPWVGPPP